MGTNCFKSDFRNAIRDDLGQLQLFMCDSEAHSDSSGLLAKSGKPFFFSSPSKELFVHILCLLNKVPESTEEKERTGFAFVVSGTFCTFIIAFCSAGYMLFTSCK